MSISGRTRLYGLIGEPVEHSYSPFIMNRAFAEIGHDGIYAAFAVQEARVPAALMGMKAMGMAGINVTFPLKAAVMPFINRPSQRVELLGAANTLTFRDGLIHGENTDAPGTAIALETLGGIKLKQQHAVIFGAGGAARATAFGLLEAGCSAITFIARHPSRAEEEIMRLRSAFPDPPIVVLTVGDPLDAGARRYAVEDAGILINATPIGMQDPCDPSEGFPLLDDPAWITSKHCALELVYRHSDTPFLHIARAQDACCLDGLGVLAAQAREAFQVWTGESFDLAEMFAALTAHAEPNR